MPERDKYEESLRVLVVMRDKSKEYAARGDVPLIQAGEAFGRANALEFAIEAIREKWQRERAKA